MKLETLGPSMILIAAITALYGCKQKSGFEQLDSQMASAKAIHTVFVMSSKGSQPTKIEFLVSKPNRFLITSADFSAVSNEEDGHFETVYSHKVYDFLPWDGKPVPGTGKILPAALYFGGPVIGFSAKLVSPEAPWKLLSNKGGVESYEKKVDSQEGPVVYHLDVKSDGTLIRYVAPGGVSFDVQKFEYLSEQPIDKFRFEAKEGYVSTRTATDTFTLTYGQKFDFSKFKSAAGTSEPKGPYTLVALLDPAEPTSTRASAWLAKAGVGYEKVTVSKGQSSTGYFDPNGAVIDKLTTTTPTFLLLNKNRVIVGMWMGYDANRDAELEKDIKTAMEEPDGGA